MAVAVKNGETVQLLRITEKGNKLVTEETALPWPDISGTKVYLSCGGGLIAASALDERNSFAAVWKANGETAGWRRLNLSYLSWDSWLAGAGCWDGVCAFADFLDTAWYGNVVLLDTGSLSVLERNLSENFQYIAYVGRPGTGAFPLDTGGRAVCLYTIEDLVLNKWNPSLCFDLSAEPDLVFAAKWYNDTVVLALANDQISLFQTTDPPLELTLLGADAMNPDTISEYAFVLKRSGSVLTADKYAILLIEQRLLKKTV